MIQINLLPDIKAEYVSAQRTKRLMVGIAVIVSVASLALVALLSAMAFGAQQLQLNNVQKKIDTAETKLNEINDLDKILTIQNQLIELTPLHDGKPVVSRLFGYLQQTTPLDITIENFSIDYAENTISVSGKAQTFEQVNRYVDTLKFTEFILGDPAAEEQDPKQAFSSVVLSSFGIDDDAASYSIDMLYDKQLYDSANTSVVLRVPALTTTRSQTQLPGVLFVEDQEGE